MIKEGSQEDGQFIYIAHELNEVLIFLAQQLFASGSTAHAKRQKIDSPFPAKRYGIADATPPVGCPISDMYNKRLLVSDS